MPAQYMCGCYKYFRICKARYEQNLELPHPPTFIETEQHLPSNPKLYLGLSFKIVGFLTQEVNTFQLPHTVRTVSVL